MKPPNLKIAVRARDLIKPLPDDSFRCVRAVLAAISYVDQASSSHQLSPGQVRRRLRQVQEVMGKALVTIGNLDDSVAGMIEIDLREQGLFLERDRWLEVVGQVWQSAEYLADIGPVPRSGGPKKARQHVPRKVAAAEQSYRLIKVYGHRRPTTSTSGDWLLLASLLYEASTGREEVSIARQCRALARKIRNRH